MERVVYVLGAGFSAPLGLPLMSNFLFKSKDMFAAHPDRYHHFAAVFDQITEMSVVKNFYDTDLFNIEETLSIQEMSSLPSDATGVDAERLRSRFAEYVGDVIEYHTPEMPDYDDRQRITWEHELFGGNNRWHKYGCFVASLLRLKVWRDKVGSPNVDADEPSEVNYSVVTFNYDRVLESVVDRIRGRCKRVKEIGFKRDSEPDATHIPSLLKLHGCVSDRSLVPPTWIKVLNESTRKAWAEAHEVLTRATQIRFVGYSLPASDTYARYLFKSASMNAARLKKIDVLCLDSNGSVEERYDRFLTFPYYRFTNADVGHHLDQIYNQTNFLRGLSDNTVQSFDRLEYVHNFLMS